MPISIACIDAHIATHEARLSASYRSYREKWPSRLFHHAPLANAVQILQSARLLSRIDSDGIRQADIAGTKVINLTDTAHRYSRLYFRPRTPTQYHVEGIRRPSDYYNGDANSHAPVLVMFVFHARSILSIPDVLFSDRNMQSPYAESGNTEEFFTRIPFEKVYHEGGTNGDHSIITARCAEVLAPSPLPLADHIQWVYCRSQAERQTLLYLLGQEAPAWAPHIRVSDDIQVFQKDYMYVESVSIQDDGIYFRFHQRPNRWNVNIRLQVWTSTGDLIIRFEKSDWNAMLTSVSANWTIKTPLSPGLYIVEIVLEGCLAYRSQLLLDPKPF